MGSLERRLAALEAQLADMWDSHAPEERIAREALSMLSAPELKLIVTGLERAGEVWKGHPPDAPLPAEVWEEHLTEEEFAALAHLEELKAGLREEAS
jgi:hypothetical protein